MSLQNWIGINVYFEEDGELVFRRFSDTGEAEDFMDEIQCWDYEHVWEDIPGEQIVFVNCYLVTREFGGREEGGWYFNRYSCREVIPVQYQYAEQMKKLMAEKYEKEHKHGNIYSVLGGQDVEVFIETEPAGSETRQKPVYE